MAPTRTGNGGRKGKARKKDQKAQSDDDWTDTDTISVSSERSTDSNNIATTDEDSLSSLVAENIDNLGEKRTSTRVDSLRRLSSCFTKRFVPDIVEERIETLLDALKRCLKREAAEASLSSNVVSLVFATVGPRPDLYNDLAPVLKELIRSTNNVTIKASCIETLSIAAFISVGDDVFALVELLDHFQSIFIQKGASPIVVGSALTAYGLLMSCMPYLQPLGERFLPSFDAHMKILNSEDLDLRIAAGENLALICELLEHDSSLSLDHGRETKLLDALTSLAVESTKHRAKKDNSTQRAAFKDILKTVEGGEPPYLKLKFKHDTVEFEGWAKIKQLNVVRKMLGQGMSIHFHSNPLLQRLFEFTPVATAEDLGMSSASVLKEHRKAENKALDKLRTRAINSGRRGKRAVADE
ncbi:Interferon- developmental regulator 2, partial [Quaeritorhiza haematococci]